MKETAQSQGKNHDAVFLQWLNELIDYGIFTTDEFLNIASWNPWLEVHTGYRAEAVIGRNLLEIYPELKERRLDRFYYQALSNQVVILSQRLHGYLLPMPASHSIVSNSQMLQSVRIAPIKTETGEVYTVTLIEDVTERVNRESELQRQIRNLAHTELALISSQARLQHLVSSSPAVIYTRLLEISKTITFVSDNVVEYLGYQSEDFTHDPKFWLSRIHPDFLEYVRDNLARLPHKNHLTLSYRFLHQNGTFRWLRDEMRLVYDLHDNLQEIVGTWYDITEQKQIEENLQTYAARLQESLEFEAIIKRTIDKVRDSLDEKQILETAVRELALVLGARSCHAALYDYQARIATINYEYLMNAKSRLGEVTAFDRFPEIYQSLQDGKTLKFDRVPYDESIAASVVSCPIFDDQGTLGDIWLIADSGVKFDSLKESLIQQIASQCAIALRQSRLYQAAQTQVQELERLNQLKDDFLSTVSHELRTPMSNIKMATEMLEVSLKQLGILADASHPLYRYVNILREEGKREIILINDLLDLTRLDAGTEPLNLTQVDLRTYIPHLAENFIGRMQQQQQQF
ncbi:MAG TPA: PAS domain S-box protein, partial [Allocoleopsis sp.]